MQINIENSERLVLEHNHSITMAVPLFISGIDVLFVGELKEVFNAENKKGWWEYIKQSATLL